MGKQPQPPGSRAQDVMCKRECGPPFTHDVFNRAVRLTMSHTPGGNAPPALSDSLKASHIREEVDLIPGRSLRPLVLVTPCPYPLRNVCSGKSVEA